MTNRSSPLFCLLACLSLVGALVFAACGDDGSTESSQGDASDASQPDVVDAVVTDSSSTSDDAPVADTSLADTNSDDSGTADTGANDTGAADTGNEDTGASDVSADADAADVHQGTIAIGEDCESSSQCLSNNCYLFPLLGGQCGQCDEDADCELGGCSPPNAFIRSDGSMCNMGEAGAGCESTEACQEGLVCGVSFEMEGLLEIKSCGACLVNENCDGVGEICAPVVSIDQLAGHRTCVGPGTLPQNSYCELGDNGNAACESGICSYIDYMGVVGIGACGQCQPLDETCPGTCQAGELNLEAGTLVGNTCVD